MKYAIINGIILNGKSDMEPQEGKVILIEDRKITEIRDYSEKESLSGYELLDMKGKYVLPGLINLHVHLPGSGKPTKVQLNLKLLVKLITSNRLGNAIGCAMAAGNAKQALFGGITTVRAVGGISNHDSIVRDQIAAGKRVGPRILAANHAISVPEGHMVDSFAYSATTPEEAAAFVDEIAADKPDLIKLMITGGVMDSDTEGEPGVIRMQAELVKAACDRAHELGLPVAAHCEGQKGVRVAVQSGVDTIEHGSRPDEEILSLMEKNKASQVMTLSAAIPYVLKLPGVQNLTEVSANNSRIVVEGMVEMAKECLKRGIPVGLGTDSACSYVTHYDLWRELGYFVQYCGVTNAFAIHTATLINAQIAGIGDITGSLEPGKMADIIAVERNPLEDLSALRRVEMVMTEGRLYMNPPLKRIAAVDEVLDTI